MLRCVLYFTMFVLDSSPATVPVATRGSLCRSRSVFFAPRRAHVSVLSFTKSAKPLALQVSVCDVNADGEWRRVGGTPLHTRRCRSESDVFFLAARCDPVFCLMHM